MLKYKLLLSCCLNGYISQHKFNKSGRASNIYNNLISNILTCNLDPLTEVVLVRARNGYRPRQVSASVFALLSNLILYALKFLQIIGKEVAIRGFIITQFILW